jgi:hypothetical protein
MNDYEFVPCNCRRREDGLEVSTWKKYKPSLRGSVNVDVVLCGVVGCTRTDHHGSTDIWNNSNILNQNTRKKYLQHLQGMVGYGIHKQALKYDIRRK